MSERIALSALLAQFRPGSHHQPWAWEDEAREVLTRECLCCGEPGHYQRRLEAHIREHGLTEGVYLGRDLVLDGNHRVVAAIHLGIAEIPLESGEQSHARWLRDHGPIDWHERKVGDRLSWEQEWRHRRLRGDFGKAEQLEAERIDLKAGSAE